MKTATPLLFVLTLSSALLQACGSGKHPDAAEPGHDAEHAEHGAAGERTIWLTSPAKRDTRITQEYVCRLRSWRHIDICALSSGYLKPISVKEGQRVREGDLLFEIMPAVYQAKLEAERAEADAARIECANTKKVVEEGVVSGQELAIAEAKLSRAEARVRLAEVELNFASIRAPFDGIIDRLSTQHGSLVSEGDVLTTLSDNSVIWAYFNVPEARYLEYVAEGSKSGEDRDIDLVLANGQVFPARGAIGAIEADFDIKTGNIAFRADFPNPDFLLRNGQTGKVRMHARLKDALVIPQRATFSVLAKRFVYAVGEDGVVHQREIEVDHELEDIFVVRSGLAEGDRIVLEGIAQVRDGEHLEKFEFRPAEEAISKQKFYAE